jgi:CelD/BcsL family acetyltransferase involved in cellulose biosynthesis
MLVEEDRALLALCREGNTVVFLGEPDLTDYHTPLGTDPTAVVAELVAALDPGDRVVLDSLPVEGAVALAEGLAEAGLAPSHVEHEVAAVLDLPASYDEYLGGLDRKQRHEIRRKRRRFEEARGDAEMLRDRNGLIDFVAMHRAAPGDKGEFMDERMEQLFSDLLDVPGAAVDLLVAGGSPVAAAFGFEDDRAYYLYNSAFAPEASASSPGVVLIDLLIRRTISSGRARFDFLKGGESYKFRFGASPRPLWRLEALR